MESPGEGCGEGCAQGVVNWYKNWTGRIGVENRTGLRQWKVLFVLIDGLCQVTIYQFYRFF